MRKVGAGFVLLVAGALVGAGGAFEATAVANGRFPESQRLVEHPTDPNRLYVTSTYGLLMTADRGRDWYYVCERAFALKFLQGDPLLEVFPDGSLLGGIYETMNLSTDCGCSWRTVLGESPTQNIIDVTTDSEGRLLALLRDDASAMSQVDVMESVDQGRTWTKRSDLPAQVTDAYTIDVAPSDPSRLYVSAFEAARTTGVFLVSKDRGQTWQQTDIPRADGAVRPFIAAVHPSNPDRIFMRMDEWSSDTAFAAQDGLLYSADAGKTWREVLHHQAKLYGFALSPDGNTVLAGYGDPFEAGGRTTNADEFGVYKASTADLAFDMIFSTTVACLRWTKTGVYVCTVPTDPSSQALAVGFAPNADFTLATKDPLTPLLDLRNVHGPLACLTASCKEAWTTGEEGTPPICDVLQARCDADLSSNNPSCGSGAGTGGSTGGAAGTGGAGGQDGGVPPGAASSGCGCRTTDRDPAPSASWMLAALWLLARRRKKRSASA